MTVVFVNEAFSGSAGTLLQTYNPDWTLHPATLGGSIVLSGDGYVRPTSTTGALYIHGDTPPSGDYYVQARVNRKSGDSSGVGLWARVHPTLNIGHRIFVTPTGTVQWHRWGTDQVAVQLWVSGVIATLGTSNLIKLVCDGDTLSLYRNEAYLTGYTETEPELLVGHVGLRTFAGVTPTNTTGAQVGEFKAETLYDVSTRRRSPLMLTPW